MPGTGEVLTTQVDADGRWQVKPTQPLPIGTEGDITVIETDAAGNASATTHLSLTIVSSLVITGSVTAGPMYAGLTILA